MLTKIKSFNEIQIDKNKKTLVICDIDDTILKYYDIPYEFINKLVKEDLGILYNDKEFIKSVNEYLPIELNKRKGKLSYEIQNYIGGHEMNVWKQALKRALLKIYKK